MKKTLEIQEFEIKRQNERLERLLSSNIFMSYQEITWIAEKNNAKDKVIESEDRDYIDKVNRDGILEKKEGQLIDNLFISNKNANSLPESQVYAKHLEKGNDDNVEDVSCTNVKVAEKGLCLKIPQRKITIKCNKVYQHRKIM